MNCCWSSVDGCIWREKEEDWEGGRLVEGEGVGCWEDGGERRAGEEVETAVEGSDVVEDGRLESEGLLTPLRYVRCRASCSVPEAPSELGETTVDRQGEETAYGMQTGAGTEPVQALVQSRSKCVSLLLRAEEMRL